MYDYLDHHFRGSKFHFIPASTLLKPCIHKYEISCQYITGRNFTHEQEHVDMDQRVYFACGFSSLSCHCTLPTLWYPRAHACVYVSWSSLTLVLKKSAEPYLRFTNEQIRCGSEFFLLPVRICNCVGTWNYSSLY